MTDEKKEMHDKPLDKMTVTELREVAKEIPEITGVHGMKKAELLGAIKEAKGITDEPKQEAAPAKKAPGKAKDKKVLSVKDIKSMIKELKSQRSKALAEKDRKMAKVFKRRISRLKKKTRQAA